MVTAPRFSIRQNWDTGVPTASDDAVINVAAADPTITVNGDANVNSLVTEEAITFTGGATFTVATTAEVNAAATISGATIVGAHFTGSGTLQVTSADGTLDGVTLGVDTTLLDGAVVTVLNGLTLDDPSPTHDPKLRVQHNNSYNGGQVQLNFSGGSQTLGGSGVVELFSSNSLEFDTKATVRPTNGGTLTIGSGITVQNTTNSWSTTLGDASLPLIIEGTVISQSTTAHASAYLRVTGSSVTNHGTLQSLATELDVNNLSGNVGNVVINGGDLDLDGNYSFDQPVSVQAGSLTLRGDWTNASTIDQSGGTISLGGTFTVSDLGTFTGTAGTVNIFGTLDDVGATLAIDSDRTWQLGGGTIRGVTIADNGDGGALGTFRVSSSDGTLDGVTLGVDTTLLDGAVVTVLNGLTLDDPSPTHDPKLRVQHNNSYNGGQVQLNFSGGSQTLGGSGVVELFSSNSLEFDTKATVRPTNGGTLTIGSGITVQNTTNSWSTTLGDASLPLIIEGTVISQSTTAHASAYLRVTGSSVTNHGDLDDLVECIGCCYDADELFWGNINRWNVASDWERDHPRSGGQRGDVIGSYGSCGGPTSATLTTAP